MWRCCSPVFSWTHPQAYSVVFTTNPYINDTHILFMKHEQPFLVTAIKYVLPRKYCHRHAHSKE
jgi:hypothetical protein